MEPPEEDGSVEEARARALAETEAERARLDARKHRHRLLSSRIPDASTLLHPLLYLAVFAGFAAGFIYVVYEIVKPDATFAEVAVALLPYLLLIGAIFGGIIYYTQYYD
ncbi:MAG: hypothetical protein KY468_07345 [Armatimonadetes bacterium]|nr:hypothetical protein [Armatimonadota bacterium]